VATSVGAFIPLSFAPGGAYQFDWSHEVVLIEVAGFVETAFRPR
jgi:hypothetical protein